MGQALASDEQVAWEKSCPRTITSDVIWKLDAYRAAMFLMHLSRADCLAMLAASPGNAVAEQLLRATASVSANIGEGYSRSTRADRLRFFDYALGSTRECVTWYQAARELLPDEVIDERLRLLTRIRALLLGLIKAFRATRTASPRFEP
jgi:four helix bundle protein